VKVRPVGFELLPPKFTLTQLQQLYEAILEDELDKRNFRKKILSMDFIVDLNESQEGVAHRPARLYEFNKEKYRKFVEQGFIFDFAFSNSGKNAKKNFEHQAFNYLAPIY
jgi:8-oxo-dGTP diphosphatase